MKKISTLLLVLVALLALPKKANADEAKPTALWGKALQTAQTTQGGDIALASDGNIYVVGNAATRAADEEVKFGDDAICTGTQYRGSNANSSVSQFMLSKVSKDGNVLWTVRSKEGDVGSQVIHSVKDGLICFMSIRLAVDALDQDIIFVDQGNNEFKLNATGSKTWYQGVVMKVSDSGLIQWLRIIDVNHDGASQGIYPNDIVVDDEENIFICGNQRTQFTLKKSDNTDVSIDARNVTGWDGDAQKSVGDLFVIKLDKDGYYLNHIQTTGAAEFVTAYSMDIKNGKIYLMGLVKGTADGKIAFGGKEVTLANANQALCTAAINIDLTVDWFQLYASDKSGGVVNTPKILAGSDYLWVMGKTNMQNIGGNTNITTTLGRDAMLLKVSPTDGALQGGIMRKVNQSGFFAAFEGKDGYLYAATHVMTLTATSTKSMSLYQIDMTDLTVKKDWVLIDKTSDVQGIVVTNDGLIYTMTRNTNNTGNKKPLENYMVDDNTKLITQSSTGFSCNICAFLLPVKPLSAPDATFDFVNNPSNWPTSADIADYETGKVTTLTVDNVQLTAIQNNDWVGNILYKGESDNKAVFRVGKFNAFKLNAPEGKALVKVAVTMATDGQTFDFETSNGAIADNVWTGNATEVTFTTSTNRQIAKIDVMLADENSETIKPAAIDVEADNIAAFNAAEDDKVVKLTLTDARVNAVKGGSYYVEDASGATVIKGVELTVGTKLNGYIVGKKSTDASIDMNEVVVEYQMTADDASTFEASATTLEGTVTALTEAGVQANYGKLITFENVTISGGQNKTLTDANNNTFKARDYMGVLPADYTWPTNASKITGVLVYYYGWVLMPISADAIVADTDGIQNINVANAQNMTIYNLQGVRQNGLKKGLNIVNGKKIVIK